MRGGLSREHIDRHVAREVAAQRGPELGRTASVVQVPQAHSAEVGAVDECVFVSEGHSVIPVELARALHRGVGPGVPAFLAGKVVGIAMGHVAARLEAGARGAELRRGVQICVCHH